MVRSEAELRKNSIIVSLNSYEDIFSDFDPGSYRVRGLSDDFLIECKKASMDKDSVSEVIFLVPKKGRKVKLEKEIKIRLRNHFEKHFLEKKKKVNAIKKTGGLWFLSGAVIMTLATFLYSYEGGFLHDFIQVLSEPAGWFMFWEGLDKVFIESKTEMPDFEFYKRLSKATITFMNSN